MDSVSCAKSLPIPAAAAAALDTFSQTFGRFKNVSHAFQDQSCQTFPSFVISRLKVNRTCKILGDMQARRMDMHVYFCCR